MLVRGFFAGCACLTILAAIDPGSVRAAAVSVEPVEACVVPRLAVLDAIRRAQIARCLQWYESPQTARCAVLYPAVSLNAQLPANAIQVEADRVSLSQQGRSDLQGNVVVEESARRVTARTAYVYRDNAHNQITRIELLGNVHYLEADRVMIAKHAVLNVQDKSGEVDEVIYRFSSTHGGMSMPAWGRAEHIRRMANKDYYLEKTTYSTCAPTDRAWHIEAGSLHIEDKTATGVARNATLWVGNVPLLYTPYLTFPTSKARKSGFLMPKTGYSNVGGFDLALPYYWNIAPNYDATLTPTLYSERGMMLGGSFRYLMPHSQGIINAQVLPKDRAFKSFLLDNQTQYPALRGVSDDRWAFDIKNTTRLYPDLTFNAIFQQVSDEYYLQDFSTNLAVLTQRQLLREGSLTYTTDNWLFNGKVQSYQTLQPFNETPVSFIYERLPQLLAQGYYDSLPLGSTFSMTAQYDAYHWPNQLILMPQGSRYLLNPAINLPLRRSFGYVTPEVSVVQNNYDVNYNRYNIPGQTFNYAIPRYSVDSGLYFDRSTSFFEQAFTQTLEPRLYYLYVPFENQTPIPVYDSAYMIFNVDQVFRNNRFSGWDRIGDTHQLSYALTTRWLSNASGMEAARLTVGQIRYFADRKVDLCQSRQGSCVDTPLMLGYLSPRAQTSPIAARGMVRWNPQWAASADYVWDTYTRSTNNAQVDIHYQGESNRLLRLGYTYLVNADITGVAGRFENSPLHQASFALALPYNDSISALAAYSYNISKGYEMMSLIGVQYDSCCWALRVLGGRTFQSLSNQLHPQYNNNVYLQVLLKGLGSVGNRDPASLISTFLPGYVNRFR